MLRLLFTLLLFAFATVPLRAAELPRSLELHFADGYSDRLALDSAMTVDMRDGMLTFSTPSGHILFDADELTGWDFSSEKGRPLLNDIVTSEDNISSDRPHRGAFVQISDRRIYVFAAEPVQLTLATTDGLTPISSSTDSDGRWQSSVLAPGIYILDIGGKYTYKVSIK